MNKSYLVPGRFILKADNISFTSSSSSLNGNPIVAGLAPVGSTPNANGASISGSLLNLQPSSATQPGVNTTGAQTYAGVKTFSSSPLLPATFGASPGTPQMMIINASGALGSQAIPSASGVTTMAAVGAVPNANGASISGSTLTLQPASSTLPGVNTAAAQTFGGLKTFNAGTSIPQGTFYYGITTDGILPFMGLASADAGDFSFFCGPYTGHPGVSTGDNNACFGYGPGNFLTTGHDNALFGGNTAGRITDGNFNSIFGSASLNAASTNPTRCASFGYNNGDGWTGGTESENLIFGNDIAGVSGETGIMRLGKTGSQTSAFAAGIHGVTVAASTPIVIDANGEMGTVVSSKKYKHDIEPITENRILDLECMSFKMNNDDTNATKYGFIAESLVDIIPDAITWEPEKDPQGKLVYDSRGKVLLSKDPQGIDYGILWPLLQDQVKKMAAEVRQLKRQMESLNGRPSKKPRLS
jgi:hypothetical protein